MGKSSGVKISPESEDDASADGSSQSSAGSSNGKVVNQAREREKSIGDMVSALKGELEIARVSVRRAEGVQHLGTTGAVGGGVDTGGAAEMVMDAKQKVSTLEAQLQELHHASKFNQEEMIYAEKEQKEAQKKRDGELKALDMKRKELDKKRETEELENSRRHMLERKQSLAEHNEVKALLSKQKEKDAKKAAAREEKMKKRKNKGGTEVVDAPKKLTSADRRIEIANRRALVMLKPLVKPDPEDEKQEGMFPLIDMVVSMFTKSGDGEVVSRFSDGWSLKYKTQLKDWAGVNTCKDGVRVEGLFLADIELTGRLEGDIWSKFLAARSNMSNHLTYLDMSRNPIAGKLSCLNTLSSLKSLRLDYCEEVTGEIDSLTVLSHLETLSLKGCGRLSGDVGALCSLHDLTDIDVSQCDMVTELPTSWLLRVVRASLDKGEVKKAWPPWGDGDWRSCYKRLKARPQSGSAWIAKRNPELAEEWEQEGRRHQEWPFVDFSKSVTDLPAEAYAEDEGSAFFTGGDQPQSWGGKKQESMGAARSNSRGSVNFSKPPSRDSRAEGSDSEGEESDASSVDSEERSRRREKRRLLETPSNNAPSPFGGKVASLGWIVALRIPNCDLELDLEILVPCLINRNLRSLDLSRNKKLGGDVEVFRDAGCFQLVDLFLHFTDVTGDFKSVSKRFLPAIQVCLLQGTKVIGNLVHLPGEATRSAGKH